MTDGSVVTVPSEKAHVDLDQLRGHLNQIVEEAKQNDPVQLKATIKRLQDSGRQIILDETRKTQEIIRLRDEIAGLQNQLEEEKEKQKKQKKQKSDPAELKRAIDAAQRAEDFSRQILDLVPRLQGAAGNFLDASRLLINGSTDEPGTVRVFTQPRPMPKPVMPKPVMSKPVVPTHHPVPKPQAGASPYVSAAGARILRALFWLKDEEFTPPELAFYAGYTVNGHFNNTMGQLRSAGFVQGWSITAEGLAQVPADTENRPTGSTLREWMRDKLDAAENKLLDALIEAGGRRMSAEELASAAGYTVNGHFNNCLGHMRKIQVAEGYARDGGTKAADVFFK